MFSLILLLALTLHSVQSYTDNDDYIIYGYENDVNGNNSHNLVKDWDMEWNETEGDYDHWWGKGATFIKTTEDSNTGIQCIKTTNRIYANQGAYTWVYNDEAGTIIKPSSMYYLSTTVKLITNTTKDPKQPYTKIRLFYGYINNDNKPVNRDVGRLTFQLADGRWKQIGGDMITPEYIVDHLEVRVQVEPEDVEYYIDSVAVTEIEPYDDWRTVLQAKVDKVRTTNLNIRTVLPEGTPLSETEIKVEMIRHQVGFGTAIRNYEFLNNMKYRNFILNNFNEAVAENEFKWSVMAKKEQIQIDFTTQDEGLKILLDNNFIVRGHNLVWEEVVRNPHWIQELTIPEKMKEEIWKRIKYMMEHFKGKIDEWDVCNEVLQYHFYEKVTGDLGILFKEFEEAHRIDPDTRLCLSDYLIARTGWFASAQKELALKMKDLGLPIGCVGVQSHLRTIPLDIERLYKRMLILAQAKMSISVTELSIHAKDIEDRKTAIEQALYVYFSIPDINIINLWGFTDQPFAFDPNSTALTTGPDFIPNIAGEALLDLIHKTWKTSESYTPDILDSTKTIRAYHGFYRATVIINEAQRAVKEFVVNKGDDPASVEIVVEDVVED